MLPRFTATIHPFDALDESPDASARRCSDLDPLPAVNCLAGNRPPVLLSLNREDVICLPKL
jgi:hypothetical protein